jgi:hypothetical protein
MVHHHRDLVRSPIRDLDSVLLGKDQSCTAVDILEYAGTANRAMLVPDKRGSIHMRRCRLSDRDGNPDTYPQQPPSAAQIAVCNAKASPRRAFLARPPPSTYETAEISFSTIFSL